MLGDNHAAWTIRPRDRRQPHSPRLPASWGFPGMGRASRGSAAPKIVDSAGVMGSSSAGERAGYSDHGVPGSLVGDWRRRAEGFPMDWSQCAS